DIVFVQDAVPTGTRGAARKGRPYRNRWIITVRQPSKCAMYHPETPSQTVADQEIVITPESQIDHNTTMIDGKECGCRENEHSWNHSQESSCAYRKLQQQRYLANSNPRLQ